MVLMVFCIRLPDPMWISDDIWLPLQHHLCGIWQWLSLISPIHGSVQGIDRWVQRGGGGGQTDNPGGGGGQPGSAL